jgi:dihydroorotate dehydrogenase
LPVECGSLDGSESRLQVSKNMQGSWAVSFGMPSADPEIWRRDIEWTRDRLPANKRLCVSVVGTVQPDWSMQQLADDYAICAKWAIESGADVVETNFSCPNVDTCDGQLFQNANGARLVAQTVRAAIGSVPLIIKIGHSTDKAEIHNLLASVGDHATALAMTNSIATTVGPSDERPLFEGQKRGICGKAIHQASVAQVRRVDRIQADTKQQLRWIGVGGIDTFRDVQDYLDAGAEACQLATAVMCDPEVAIKIRASAASERTRS